MSNKKLKCDRKDCFAYHKEFNYCMALDGSYDISKGCSFYTSDPDDTIREKIQKDIDNYIGKRLIRR